MLQNMRQKTLQKPILRMLQFSLALSIFTYLIRVIDWPQAYFILQRADLIWFSLASCLSFLAFFPLAKRYADLLQAIQVSYPWRGAYRAYLAGAAASIIMPGAIGGDVVRIGLCRQQTQADLGHITSIVLLERILGIIVLLLMLSLGMPSGLTPLFVIIALSLPACFPKFWRSLMSVRFQASYAYKYLKWISYLQEKLDLFKNLRAQDLYLGLFLSFLGQLCDVFVTYCLAFSLGFHIPFTLLMVVMPVTYLMITLPISPGGLGLREGAFMMTLAWLAIPHAEAALLALVVFLNRALVGVMGGFYVFIFNKTAIKIDSN